LATNVTTFTPVTQTNPNETWRNYTKRSPITSCKLGGQDLKRLHRLVNEKQAEVGTRLSSSLSRTAQESREDFDHRVSEVRDAFITTITVTGADGQAVTGHGESFFDSELLPTRIESILFDTSFSPNAILKYTPADRATVFLDFSRPRLLDFNGQPSAPTPNNSNWFVTGATESWATSLSKRLEDFFKERGTALNWLHGPATYDGLLMLVGFPVSLWGAYRLGSLLPLPKGISSSLSAAIYIYLFFVFLNVFRALFSYARWVFPKVDLDLNKSSASRHRVTLSVIVLGVIATAVWDGIKIMFGK